MTISSRTPEGQPNVCPTCGKPLRLEPSRPTGDAPCPHCGTLLWFDPEFDAPPMTAWEYGLTLVSQGQRADGLSLLRNVVASRPSDVELRRSLRELERQCASQLADEEPAVQLNEVWCEIHRAKRGRGDKSVEWDRVDGAVERGLAIDLGDANLHVELARACEARGYIACARFAYECALEIAPDRADAREAIRQLAMQGGTTLAGESPSGPIT